MAKKQILVVEDETSVAEVIQDCLVQAGYTVVGMADSGEEALNIVEEEQPDLVLMDIGLKGQMDGIDTADQIHRRFDIPVIYLTACSDKATLQRADITSPVGYLLKPFEEGELLGAIESALGKQRQEDQEPRRWSAAS